MPPPAADKGKWKRAEQEEFPSNLRIAKGSSPVKLTEASECEQDIFAEVSLPSESENSYLADFASCSLRSLQSARYQGALLR